MKKVTRRGILTGFAAGVGASLTGLHAGCADVGKEAPVAAEPKKLREFKNEEFYKDGEFDVAAAKKAYYELMEHYDYPIPDRLRGEDFWTLDFGLGKFMEVGMAGIFWINNLEGDYFGHEIYLLPGQMIAEHQHMKTEKTAAKMEGWHVRHGWVYIYGEGEPTPGVEARIPPTHKKCAVARTEKILKPGETACLGKPCEKHWMRAGPEGAIVSEYATAHDMAGLRFSHPDVKL
jgi:D-lyxose ketol-isomerase